LSGKEEGRATSGYCDLDVPLFPSLLIENKHLMLSDLEVQLGVPSGACLNSTCENVCPTRDKASAAYLLDTSVRISLRYAPRDDSESLTRLLLGVAFGVVWTLVIAAPIILWIRRRQARTRARHLVTLELAGLDNTYEGGGRGNSRHAALVHGIHAKSRRFKALKVSDWETVRGVTRRRHGWRVADAAVTREGMAILEKQVGLPGRNAPTTVVAKLEAGWVKITRPAVRGQVRLIEVTDDEEVTWGRDEEQVHDYLLITLPQSVRYAEGMSGEIKIDVHGMPVQWVGDRDRPALRGKLRGMSSASLPLYLKMSAASGAPHCPCSSRPHTSSSRPHALAAEGRIHYR